MSRYLCVAALVVFVLVPGSLAQEAPAPSIGVELNDLQQAETGCRAVFVMHNGLSAALDQLTFRIVAFDADSRASLFLSLEVGSLPENKTRVLRFDLGENVQCDDVSRLLLDDVTNCEGDGMDSAACLAAVEISSRLDVPLDY